MCTELTPWVRWRRFAFEDIDGRSAWGATEDASHPEFEAAAGFARVDLPLATPGGG